MFVLSVPLVRPPVRRGCGPCRSCRVGRCRRVPFGSGLALGRQCVSLVFHLHVVVARVVFVVLVVSVGLWSSSR